MAPFMASNPRPSLVFTSLRSIFVATNPFNLVTCNVGDNCSTVLLDCTFQLRYWLRVRFKFKFVFLVFSAKEFRNEDSIPNSEKKLADASAALAAIPVVVIAVGRASCRERGENS